MRVIRIGFVGFSYGKFSSYKAKKILNEIFDNIKKKYVTKYDVIEIVTGGTALGIPHLVYQYAEQNKYQTVGIMCKDGYNYPLYPCDKIIAIGTNWGDESQFFINYIDILYKIGGGSQSEYELELAKKAYKPVFEFELERLPDSTPNQLDKANLSNENL